MTQKETLLRETAEPEIGRDLGVQEGKRLSGAGEVKRGSGNERRRDWK